MAELSEEEKQRILASPPRGTWAILMIFAAVFMLAWLFMYFGVFLSRGPIA